MTYKPKNSSNRLQCNAVVRNGLRCIHPSSLNSKWCSKHEEDQAKFLKTYKRFSADLNQFNSEIGTSKMIEECLSIDALKRWQENARKKWTLAKRAKDARIKHHRSFYYGGDSGHSAYISHLENIQQETECLIGELDHRAYYLLVSPETSEWLMEQVDNNDVTRCGDDSNDEDYDDDDKESIEVDMNIDDDDDERSNESSSLPKTPPLIPTTPYESRKNLEEFNEEEKRHSLDMISPLELFHSVSPTSNYSDNANSLDEEEDNNKAYYEKPTLPSKHSILLGWLRDYIEHGQNIADEENRATRLGMMSNIFRVAISRTPSLLAVASQAGANISVSDFVLQDKYLSTDDLHLLWKRLKYAKGDKGSKRHGRGTCGIVTPELIRNAIIDVKRTPSSSSDECNNGGGDNNKLYHYLNILGGYVWKKPLERPMSSQEWDHFYQFISCSGCALSVTRSLSEWMETRKLCQSNSRYSAWSNSTEHPTESKLRILGGIISSCGEQKTKLERVKPKARGLKTVLVERSWRSWVFMRMATTSSTSSELIEDIISRLSEDFTVIFRKPVHMRLKTESNNEEVALTSPSTISRKSDNQYWISRVRTGYSSFERRSAPWTTESCFRKQDVLDRFADTSYFETRFSRKFPDSWDIVIMDNDIYESYDAFLTRVIQSCSRVKDAAMLLEAFSKKRDNPSSNTDWFHDQLTAHQVHNLFNDIKCQYI